MRVRFWGVRGSIASPGTSTVRYGGNTSCIQVTAPSGETLILDSGTGIRALGQKIAAEGAPLAMGLLITHTHWDHIQGFPYFAPIYLSRFAIDLFGPRLPTRSIEEIFSIFLAHEFHPVRKMELAARIRYRDLGEESFAYGPFQVRTCYAHHPVVALSYRISCAGRTVVYTGDHEPYFPVDAHGGAEADEAASRAAAANARYAAFVKGADLLVADAMYTAEDYEKKRLWGHGSIDHAVALAAEAGCRRLRLFHHEPNYSDDVLDGLQRDHLPALLRRLGAEDLEVRFAAEGQDVALA